MSSFIHESDFSTLIREELIERLESKFSYTRFSGATSMAVSQVKNYLADRYDIETIFQAYDVLPDPDPRNAHILMIVLDCAIYHIYTANAPNKMPQFRSLRYADALEWLKDVGKGKMSADLPTKMIGENKDKAETGIRITSRPPVNHRW